MIPRALVTEWRAQAPWPSDAQIEQDLVLSRAIVELFSRPEIASSLALRGGTALHKLFFRPAGRYSEDIDLVQLSGGPIGEVLSVIRACLDPWLGQPRYKHGQGRVTLTYRFDTSLQPVQPMRLKIEINTREHFSVLDVGHRAFSVDSRWFSGTADVRVYALDELLGTKLRALYQRKKGRDLYDLWRGLAEPDVLAERIVACFVRYMAEGGTPVSRAEFEENLAAKLVDAAFALDIMGLLPTGAVYDAAASGALVGAEIIARIPGDAWKGAGS